MTIKGSDIFNKIMGAGLMLTSVGFFANIGFQDAFIVPGALFAAAGLFFATRRDRHPNVELDVQRRIEHLADSLAATQQELIATQERVERLSDERDFMRQLAGPPASVASRGALPAREPDPDGPGN